MKGASRPNLAIGQKTLSGHNTVSGPKQVPGSKVATNHKAPRHIKSAFTKRNNIPKSADKSIAAEAKVAKLIAIQSVEVEETEGEEDPKPFAISASPCNPA